MATAAVSRRQQRHKARVAKMRSRAGSRWRTHYDIDGPRIRLGLLWFSGAVVAFVGGRFGIALYFAVASGAAAAHGLRTWAARRIDLEPAAAMVVTVVAVGLAALGPRLLAVGVFALVGVAVATTLQDQRIDLARAGLVLQCALPCLVGGGAVALLADREVWSALSLVLLVSSYEVGDYTVGSGASNALEGPLAGTLAVLVMAMTVAAAGFPPLDLGQTLFFGVLVGPLAIAGQYLATAMLPHARAFAPALRRIDSYLLAAPFWYVVVDRLG